MRENPLPQIFGANIKRLRISYGWNQSELSQKMNIAQSAVSKIERGAYSFSADTILQAAETFEVEPWELIRPPQTSIADKIAELERTLYSEEERLVDTKLAAQGKTEEARARNQLPDLTEERLLIQALEESNKLIRSEIARLKSEYPEACSTFSPTESALAKRIAEQQKELDALRAELARLAPLQDIIEALRNAEPGRLLGVRAALGLARAPVAGTKNDSGVG